MADVKWIKIVTDIFDDEKILLIESMPSPDSMIVIWFKLLCFAGKQNNSGVIMLNDRIAYTDEMLATIFRRDVNTVRMALKVFEEFGMIRIVDGVITIPNWGKHQNLDQLERKKEYQRKYMREYREKQKLLSDKSAISSAESETNCKSNSNAHVSRLDKEGDIDKDRDIDRESIRESVPDSAPTPTPDKPKKHKHGEYNNVLLTDEELDKLKDSYPDWQDRIERLSEYIASSGKRYKSHYATIRAWAKKDAHPQPVIRRDQSAYTKPTKAEEMNDFYNMAAEWAAEGENGHETR
jgi:predicted phage replisome organizer